MSHPFRTAAIGLMAVLCALVAALGAGVSPLWPQSSAQTAPTPTSLSTSGEITLAFANQSDGHFPPGVSGIQLELDADLTVEQRLSGSGAAMRVPTLQLEIEGDGATFDDHLGGETRRSVPLSLSSAERSCQSGNGWSCTIKIKRDHLSVPPLKLAADASGQITVRATLDSFGLYRANQPNIPILAQELERLSFTAAVTLTVGETERISDLRLYLSFPDDSDGHVAPGFGSDGIGGARIGLSLEFTFAARAGETISNLKLRLDAYGRVEVPRLLGSDGLEIEKSGLGGLSTGSCRRASARSNRWRCELSGYQARALVPYELPLGAYRVSGNARLLGLSLSYSVSEAGANYTETVHWEEFDTAPGSRTLHVSEQREVATVTLELIENQPSIIPAQGGQTRIRLSIHNANGDPSNPRQINAIIITTSRGSLHFVKGGACESSCNLSGQRLSRLDPEQTGSIDLVLTADSEGSAEVRALVGVLDGGDNLGTTPLRIDFSGVAVALSLGQPDGSLHYIRGADPVTIKLSAHDLRGVATAPTNLRFSIVGPNQETIGAAQIQAQQRGDALILITRAGEDNSLEPGTYILQARSGNLSAQRALTVSGPPTQITMNTNPASGSRIGQIITVSARIADAQSQLVANGLPVRIESLNAHVLVGVDEPNIVTDQGLATRWFGVNQGGEAVLVASTNNGEVIEAEILRSHAPRRDGGSPLISDRVPDGRAVWLGAKGFASLLVPRLRAAGIIGVWTRTDNTWTGYAIDHDGEAAPGSKDFTLQSGDTLYPIP